MSNSEYSMLPFILFIWGDMYLLVYTQFVGGIKDTDVGVAFLEVPLHQCWLQTIGS